ncbi:MAG: hypothetical protein IPL32_03530 [Chloracidobacterium sp.]|nr:hypothetical protein [Chloracidobacterium sp.]
METELDLLFQELNQATKSYRSCDLPGFAPEAAKIYHWKSWPVSVVGGKGFRIKSDNQFESVFWIEPDSFNSDVLSDTVARLHWCVKNIDLASASVITKLATILRGLLESSNFSLLGISVLGHNARALELFQQAGAKFIVSNVWLYRRAGKPPQIGSLSEYKLQWNNLNVAPLSSNEIAEAMNLAEDCFFDDRFSLDVNIGRKAVSNRFKAVIRNGLGGHLGEHVITARKDGYLAGLVFFGTNASKPPIAGNWFTMLINPSDRGKHLGERLFAEAISKLPQGPAEWFYKCTLQNFASFEASRALGFRIGAIAHDLHYWRRG